MGLLKQGAWSLVFLLVLFHAASVAAVELEGIVAGSHVKVDGVPLQSGISANFRLLLNDRGPSFYLQSNFPGISIGIFDAILGFTFRTQGQWYLEAGGGFRYARLWGSGWALNGGLGYRFSQRWYVALPVYYRLDWSVEILPYIGVRL